MPDKWLEEIREKISCPQLGDDHYGEWGILTKNQRLTIKRMLDYINGQEAYINRLKAENERLRNDVLAKEYEYNDMLEQRNSVERYLETAKAEAYKEFAERLKAKKFKVMDINEDEFYVVEVETIDNLLKELVRDANASN